MTVKKMLTDYYLGGSRVCSSEFRAASEERIQVWLGPFNVPHAELHGEPG